MPQNFHCNICTLFQNFYWLRNSCFLYVTDRPATDITFKQYLIFCVVLYRVPLDRVHILRRSRPSRTHRQWNDRMVGLISWSTHVAGNIGNLKLPVIPRNYCPANTGNVIFRKKAKLKINLTLSSLTLPNLTQPNLFFWYCLGNSGNSDIA